LVLPSYYSIVFPQDYERNFFIAKRLQSKLTSVTPFPAESTQHPSKINNNVLDFHIVISIKLGRYTTFGGYSPKNKGIKKKMECQSLPVI